MNIMSKTKNIFNYIKAISSLSDKDDCDSLIDKVHDVRGHFNALANKSSQDLAQLYIARIFNYKLNRTISDDHKMVNSFDTNKHSIVYSFKLKPENNPILSEIIVKISLRINSRSVESTRLDPTLNYTARFNKSIFEYTTNTGNGCRTVRNNDKSLSINYHKESNYVLLLIERIMREVQSRSLDEKMKFMFGIFNNDYFRGIDEILPRTDIQSRIKIINDFLTLDNVIFQEDGFYECVFDGSATKLANLLHTRTSVLKSSRITPYVADHQDIYNTIKVVYGPDSPKLERLDNALFIIEGNNEDN